MRHYAAKRPRSLRNPDRRMELAVALVEGKGKSRREAATILRCSEGTIRNDLARWAALQSSNVIPLVRNQPRKTAPDRGTSTHADYAVRGMS